MNLSEHVGAIIVVVLVLNVGAIAAYYVIRMMKSSKAVKAVPANSYFSRAHLCEAQGLSCRLETAPEPAACP
jgi:hypothetical protein